MRREQFHTQLLAATHQALTFAQTFVRKRLPLEAKYVVLLNQSCDRLKTQTETLEPNDEGRMEICGSADVVTDLLHRNERCPTWIDISVCARSRHRTWFRLLCSGRWQIVERQMCYWDQGTQPFGIKSPDLPRIGARRCRLPQPREALHGLARLNETSFTLHH